MKYNRGVEAVTFLLNVTPPTAALISIAIPHLTCYSVILNRSYPKHLHNQHHLSRLPLVCYRNIDLGSIFDVSTSEYRIQN